jgi:hypothetical protein
MFDDQALLPAKPATPGEPTSEQVALASIMKGVHY